MGRPPGPELWQWRASDRMKRIPPKLGDALLYGASALFALLTIYTSTNALYEVWGRMALLPFVFGAAGLGRPGLGRAPRPPAAAR